MRRIAYNTRFDTTTQEAQYFLSLLGTKSTSSVDTVFVIPKERKDCLFQGVYNRESNATSLTKGLAMEKEPRRNATLTINTELDSEATAHRPA